MFLRALLILFIGLPVLSKEQEETYKLKNTPNKNNMVLIPKGKFIPFYKKKDQEFVEVKSFYLDIYPVTNQDFLEFVKKNPKWSKSKISRLYSEKSYLNHWASDFGLGKDSLKIYNSPVTNISWFAANAYCKWKGKRLPTTTEWEYAASADIADRKTNDNRDILEIILNWYDKPNPAITPNVGTTFKNKFGVYDMHGLIWEWVYDFNSYVTGGDSRSNSQTDRDLFCGAGAANAAGNKKDYAAFMRYGFRGSLKASYTVANLGFRCAMDEVTKK
ncbi:MAG: formylglycine-generating enzyme family protein [Bacteroidia bacterium]|nr:formylglycine-generating enzyme family protein [Bacteroidia bacterium]